MKMDNNGIKVDKRVIWHPDVHRKFSEELHYFLIKPEIYSSSFKSQVSKFLSDIGAKGFCIYDIFGNYDILLRVWLSDINKMKFAEYIDKNLNIAGIDEFIVQGFIVSWHESREEPKNPSLLDLDNLTPEIIEKAQLNKIAENEMEELASKHLLLSRMIPPLNGDYKFFVLMGYPTSVPVRENIISDQIKDFINTQKSYLKNISVYSGMGFSRYLIKAVSKDFYDILKLVLAFIERFNLLKIQTNTIIVAEENPYESDNITLPNAIADMDESTVRGLVPLLYNKQDVSMLDRNLLANKIWEIRDSFESDKDNILRKTIEHIINKDNEGLAAYLQSYFSSFERFLRDSLNKFIVGLCINNPSDKRIDPNTLYRKACESQNIENRMGSLGKWIEAYRYVINEIPIAKNIWTKENIDILKNAVTWRNKFSHAEYGNIIQDWNSLIDFLCEFIDVKKLIEEHINNTCIKKG